MASVQSAALRKLDMIDAAVNLSDLRHPLGIAWRR
jgi:plasmid maintenance system killer protein